MTIRRSIFLTILLLLIPSPVITTNSLTTTLSSLITTATTTTPKISTVNNFHCDCNFKNVKSADKSFIPFTRHYSEILNINGYNIKKVHSTPAESFESEIKITSKLREKQYSEVNILGLFELTTQEGDRPEGLSELEAAKLAVKHVNERNILGNYTLKLLTNDTKVSLYSINYINIVLLLLNNITTYLNKI